MPTPKPENEPPIHLGEREPRVVTRRRSGVFTPHRGRFPRVGAATAVLVLTILAGCGGTTPSADAPDVNPELVGVGEELYAANCVECHGADLRGTDRGPSFLSRIYEPGHHGDGAFLMAVQRGVRSHHWEFGDMPPVVGLEPDDIEAIVAFVRTTQRTEGFEP